MAESHRISTSLFFIIEKFYAVTTERAAIDINDVLHYHQFHFVLIFLSQREEKKLERVPIALAAATAAVCG